MSAFRALRSDARKNYEALVQTARKHLSSEGVTTSLDAIAREAGVGVGTLYRHFPDRDHLIFAALNAPGEVLPLAAEIMRSAGADVERLERWLVEVQNYLSSYQGLPDSIAQALDCGEKRPLAITCREIIEITDGFLTEAQHEGAVGPGKRGRISSKPCSWSRG